jgi:hypothetical protein
MKHLTKIVYIIKTTPMQAGTQFTKSNLKSITSSYLITTTSPPEILGVLRKAKKVFQGEKLLL